MIEAEPVTVFGKEKARGNPGCPLVAVHEPMVLDDAVGIGSGEVGRIGIAVVDEVHRSNEGAFNGAGIANALCAAVLGKLPVVDGKDDSRIDPAPLLWLRLVG